MKCWPAKRRASAALLTFLCLLLGAIGAHAQDDASSQLGTFQIYREYSLQFLALTGAALSPDGQKVAVAYFSHLDVDRHGPVALRLQIWNVGVQEPIASKQLSVTVPAPPFSMLSPGPEGFVRYCDHGSGIMVADTGGTLYYLNSQTLELIHATAAGNPLPGTDPERVPRRISCAADSPRAVIAYGGAFVTWDFPYMTYYGDGNGLVRLYDLTSGALLKEWNTTEPRYNFGDVAISPSGKQVAVSHVPGTPRSIPKSESFAPGPKHLQDVELFDVDTGKMTLQINAGHWPGRISFVGETQIASDDTRMAQPFYPQPRIKLWDLSNGKLLREFADPKFGARRFVAASRDGRVILGFIPKERLNGYEHNETVEQRLRLWDAATGTTIATSPRFSPHPDLQSAHKRWNEPVDPSMVLSDNGRAVVVYWKQGVFRIYVFSLPPAAPAQPQ